MAWVWIVSALLLIPLANFWCCCVSPATPVCSSPICTNGGPISQYQVDVSGMADGDCTSANCGDIDGSYTLTINPVTCSVSASRTPGNTHGAWFSGTFCCTSAPTSAGILLTFSTSLDQILVRLTTTHAAACFGTLSPVENRYTFIYTTPDIDCSTVSGLTIPFSSESAVSGASSDPLSAACTGTGATVTLTAL